VPLAVSAETTAALLGALVGGGIALLTQAVAAVYGGWRRRRIAAQAIYTELVGNLSNAEVALHAGAWPGLKPGAERAAWETFGSQLLHPWHKPHRLAAVAIAYNRVDDLAWVAEKEAVAEAGDYSEVLLEIKTGLYVVGSAAGYSDAELAERSIPVEQVKAHLARLESAAAGG
jgi:hypothetical protein